MYDTSDKQVVREIIEEYSNMVYRLALSRVKSKENAEDIYQEVFLDLAGVNHYLQIKNIQKLG